MYGRLGLIIAGDALVLKRVRAELLLRALEEREPVTEYTLRLLREAMGV